MRVLFLPWCEQDCWKWEIEAYGDRAAQREILINYLGRYKVVSCPANCALYENQTWAGWKQKVGAAWKLVGLQAVKAFRWFHSLAWQIQLAFIVLAIFALTSKWVPQIVTLLKALHGQ